MSEHETAERIAASGDADLVLRTRSGDRDAYAELWRRHYRSGITVARSITSTFDADDLVQEAYARIFQSIRRGGGPTGSFRAYLFTSIRNTAAAWGRSRREVGIDDVAEFADPRTTVQATEDALDRSLTHQAFRSLPSRWQEVLWYTEIEGMKPAEIAPLLGMTAGSVSQLAFRAREGLREAWIQVHLRSVADGSECQYAIERLGAYERNNVGRRDRTRIERHLHDCARCTIVYGEAQEAGRRLALVLLPLTVGAGGATAYLASLQGGGVPVATLAAMPSGVVDGAVLAAGAPTVTLGADAGAAGAAGAAGSSGSAGGGALSGAALAGVIGGGFAAALAVAAALVVPGLLNPPVADAAASDVAASDTVPFEPSTADAGAPAPAASAPAAVDDEDPVEVDADTRAPVTRSTAPVTGTTAPAETGQPVPAAPAPTTPAAPTPGPTTPAPTTPPSPTPTPTPAPTPPPAPPAETALHVASVQTSVVGPRQVELAVTVGGPADAAVTLRVRGTVTSATTDVNGHATLTLRPSFGHINNASLVTLSATAPDGTVQTVRMPLTDLVDRSVFGRD
ncbi:hypothetical protein GCM10022200_12690 [Microbacterium awajiense]|uniref:Sigma-70 family RNA polymerase sigma factor n=1 Tax=Microbacterium awajiense TaxID=415214 RepID=A0ABP7AFV3_9MICO